MSDLARDTRFWDRIAPRYARSRIRDQAGYERTLERTRELLKADDCVLELGCGTGTTALHLARSVTRYVGTDISGEMITIARRKLAETPIDGLSFRVFAPDAGPPDETGFDAVLAFNLLHLVGDLQACLACARAALKPGGLFISKTPCLSEMNPVLRVLVPTMRLVGLAPSVAFLDAAQLEKAILAAGFEIIATERHATRGKDTRPFIVARKA
jgi:SAM-dependent methyltransferase